ncbi:MAG TPA: cytochrome c3 family protein [Thermodesulfovibrionales bacterium]|nr:cytochrome c3 family protein [Thermodesulfovibrionales bacterium]
MSRKAIIIAVGFVVIAGGIIYTLTVAFPTPQNCVACHYMEPFYRQWEISTHKTVPCLKCHEYSAARALIGQVKLLTGKQSVLHLTNIPDKNCLQSGCHDKRLVDSKVTFTKEDRGKRTITLDHKTHFGVVIQSVKLHCRSCHSDMVQGSHADYNKEVCFLCHFKGALLTRAVASCPLCHSSPKRPLVVRGRPFVHDDALKAGYKCTHCHTKITRGDGVTPKDKCYSCHADRTDKYSDVKFIHDKHVDQKQINCLRCHPKIEHGQIGMLENIPLIK